VQNERSRINKPRASPRGFPSLQEEPPPRTLLEIRAPFCPRGRRGDLEGSGPLNKPRDRTQVAVGHGSYPEASVPGLQESGQARLCRVGLSPAWPARLPRASGWGLAGPAPPLLLPTAVQRELEDGVKPASPRPLLPPTAAPLRELGGGVKPAPPRPLRPIPSAWRSLCCEVPEWLGADLRSPRLAGWGEEQFSKFPKTSLISNILSRCQTELWKTGLHALSKGLLLNCVEVILVYYGNSQLIQIS
jgi:hypothetical protein